MAADGRGDLDKHIVERELPDITQYDTSDQVREEIRRTEEIHAFQLAGTQKSQ